MDTNIERRNEKLPCNHEFAFVDTLLGVEIIRCCSCDWYKTKKDEKHRETDLSFEEYLRRKTEFNG